MSLPQSRSEITLLFHHSSQRYETITRINLSIQYTDTTPKTINSVQKADTIMNKILLLLKWQGEKSCDISISQISIITWKCKAGCLIVRQFCIWLTGKKSPRHANHWMKITSNHRIAKSAPMNVTSITSIYAKVTPKEAPSIWSSK